MKDWLKIIAGIIVVCLVCGALQQLSKALRPDGYDDRCECWP